MNCLRPEDAFKPLFHDVVPDVTLTERPHGTFESPETCEFLDGRDFGNQSFFFGPRNPRHSIVVSAAGRAVCPPALSVHCLLPWRLGFVFRIFKEDLTLSAKKALTNRLAVSCEESECFRA